MVNLYQSAVSAITRSAATKRPDAAVAVLNTYFNGNDKQMLEGALRTLADKQGVSRIGSLEDALAVPGISPQLRAYLENFRSVWSNLFDGTDVEAARRAMRAAQEANSVLVPLTQA